MSGHPVSVGDRADAVDPKNQDANSALAKTVANHLESSAPSASATPGAR